MFIGFMFSNQYINFYMKVSVITYSMKNVHICFVTILLSPYVHLLERAIHSRSFCYAIL